MTGLQAVVRVPFDQIRRDRSRGLHTAGFVSGYPGSPVGGFDMELSRHADLMRALDIVHAPGLNEELAATAVMGSQTVRRFGEAKYDGVLGVWYGKSPGLERAGDAIRHANYWGTTRHSGTLVVVGDDPACKSSSVPSASEHDLGLHAVALSRSCGLWVALKLVTSVADGFGTVDVANACVEPELPVALGESEFGRTDTNPINPATIVQVERDLRETRMEAARRYISANGLNRVTGGAAEARLGIVAPSHTMNEVLQALQRVGLDPTSPGSRVRLLRLGALHPLDHDVIRQFARGLDEIVVVEEKQTFVEDEVVRALYGTGGPVVVGKRGSDGAALFPAYGALDADAIVAPLRSRISAVLGDVRDDPAPLAVRRQLPIQVPPRTPYYCSGCPHNTSTQVPAGTAVGAGIGCHSIVGFLDTERFGTITGVTQMGGEGAQWIGAAPFTQTQHLIQNIGDGTFFHSGQLAIQAAVAAGAHITYKLLFNGTIAMTGGQLSPGGKDIPAVVRMLTDIGVRRILITTEEPARYRHVKLPRGVEVWHRHRIKDAQRVLSEVPGVTVLIHDQHCAAHARQLRKRGQMPDPPRRIAIATRVCELCGDCGYKSNCLSVRTVETEFGPKTAIDQPSCNKDYSCVEGDCPSFVSFLPRRSPARHGRNGSTRNRTARTLPVQALATYELPEPERVVGSDEFTVRMAGIGGTGVVTVNQILGVAAQLDGYAVAGLDQTGLSQKGGAVVSDLRFSRRPIDASNKASEGAADLLLVFDQLVALSPANSKVADPERTVAVVSTAQVATGAMIGHPDQRFPDATALRAAIEEITVTGHNRYVDAGAVTNELFGSTQTSNVFLLGVAYQAGAVPVSAASIGRAIDLNGAMVATNLAAFRAGRAWVLEPGRLLRTPPPQTPMAVPPTVDAAVKQLGIDGELHELVRTRAADLADYQNERYALRYLEVVRRAIDVESSSSPGALAVSAVVAKQLHRVMAYKDEYEIARLMLLPSVRAELSAVAPGQRMYWHLHPPILRALGLRRKLRLGAWFRPVLCVLRGLRRLRGTPLDLFGATKLRRTERALVDEYTDLVHEALADLTADNGPAIAELLGRIETVRGYENIKMESIARYRTEIAELRTRVG
jgi:indolepyruvate ferredoxin oxidoreductase